MVIEQLISPEVPVLLLTDSGKRALSLMEENNLSQLPILEGEKYLALVRENDVLDLLTPESPLSASNLLDYKPAVFSLGHPFDALKLAHLQHLSIVPVVDHEQTYVGSITRDDLIRYLAENSGLENPGGIIVLEMKMLDYSLHQIARICENEDMIIISSQLHTNKATGKMEVTLKLNKTDLHPLVASFERFSYTVKEVFGAKAYDDDMHERYDMLMNYINM